MTSLKNVASAPPPLFTAALQRCSQPWATDGALEARGLTTSRDTAGWPLATRFGKSQRRASNCSSRRGHGHGPRAGSGTGRVPTCPQRPRRARRRAVGRRRRRRGRSADRRGDHPAGRRRGEHGDGHRADHQHHGRAPHRRLRAPALLLLPAERPRRAGLPRRRRGTGAAGVGPDPHPRPGAGAGRLGALRAGGRCRGSRARRRLRRVPADGRRRGRGRGAHRRAEHVPALHRRRRRRPHRGRLAVAPDGQPPAHRRRHLPGQRARRVAGARRPTRSAAERRRPERGPQRGAHRRRGGGRRR